MGCYEACAAPCPLWNFAPPKPPTGFEVIFWKDKADGMLSGLLDDFEPEVMEEERVYLED